MILRIFGIEILAVLIITAILSYEIAKADKKTSEPEQVKTEQVEK